MGGTDWVWWTGAAAMGAAGLLLLLWALFSDRARGRKRCPRCWYDMQGAPSLVCPECGRDAKKPTRLSRTRRRWRWATLAFVLVVVATAGSVVPRVRAYGWWSLVPTTVLVQYCSPTERSAATQKQSPTSEGAVSEFLRRLGNDTVWDWQLTQFVRGMRIFTVPQRWPISIPLRLKGHEFANIEADDILIMLPIGGLAWRAYSPDLVPWCPSDVLGVQYFPCVLARGDRSATLLAFVQPLTEEGYGRARQIALSFPIEAVETPDEVCPPTVAPEATRRLREALSLVLRDSRSDYGSQVYLNDAALTRVTTAYVCELEVLHEGTRVGLRSLRPDHPASLDFGDQHVVAQMLQEPSRWSFRIRGLPETKLDSSGSGVVRAIDFIYCRDYWAGEITVGAEELIRSAVRPEESPGSNP